MLIDCDSCAARDIHCGDCVVAVLLGPRNGAVELDSAEQQALDAFASGGCCHPCGWCRPSRPVIRRHRPTAHPKPLGVMRLRD